MTRILTGIQSTGRPHLGNVLGAMVPTIELAKNPTNEGLFFIADLHTLTAVKDPQARNEYVNAVAAAWLALGLAIDKNILYRQSKIPEVCELTWYLSCFTPYPMLANAHAFKNKSKRLSDVNAGLFTYPVLMTADMVLYDAEVVPVGRDQGQHLEVARAIAIRFNHFYGDTFVVPQAKIDDTVKTIPGTDGQKMSKSYKNTIDIFLPEKSLRKAIMAIITDSTPMEAPKKPATCNVFALYSMLANKEQRAAMRKNYLEGNYGYGQAKQVLFELILDTFKEERRLFNDYMKHLPVLHEKLVQGEEKARSIARQTLARVRNKLGY